MRIGVYGLGNMGSAIISGMISAGIATESGITACDVDQTKTTQAKDSLKISISSESEVCDRSELIIVAVKPYDALA
ncbi:MAG: NAD(P)-binding domain-containing protein, partial [Spirochaetota bacterium]|nr:NAD(P)-binding domain-containing protein [Spirochaetota bacterium]